MLRIYITPLFICCFIFSSSQQLPMFTQYREYQGIINPAYISHDYLRWDGYRTTFGISYRTQWSGIQGGPVTYSLRGEHMFATGNRADPMIGGYVMQDETGPISFSGAYARVAILISNNPYYGGVSLGLSQGVVQYRVKTSGLAEAFPFDPILTEEDQQKIFPDIGVGLYAYKQLSGGWFDGDNIFIGLSVPQVFGLELSFRDKTGDFSIRRTPHYFGFAGMYKYINEDTFIELASWVKYVEGAPWNVDFSMRYQAAGSIWVGAGLATSGIAHVEAGFILGPNVGWDNILRIGYGFDPSFTSHGVQFGYVHEVNLALSLDSGSE